MTLLLVGGANEALGGTNDTVGGANWPVGRVIASTLTFAGDLEVSRTFAVLRSHSSAADSSTLWPDAHTQKPSQLAYHYCWFFQWKHASCAISSSFDTSFSGLKLLKTIRKNKSLQHIL